jgi:ABC-type cobalamin/Fe3+-siderophores transport system ATPase subunit
MVVHGYTGKGMSDASRHRILELQGVGFSYQPERKFLEDLSFTICNGEFAGLLGHNGSGKSTIMKLCAGILLPSKGTVSLWNKPLAHYCNRDRAKLLCYLPQMPDVTVPFRVEEIVRMGLYPYDTPPSIPVTEALDIVGLKGKAEQVITTLSGGERRRVFIAMTLVQGAGMLLLDEPLTNLDIRYQIEFLNLLWKLREKQNISVLMALHDINTALQLERVIVLKEGSIVGDGPPARLLDGPLLKEAFGIEIDIHNDGKGKTFVSYDKIYGISAGRDNIQPRKFNRRLRGAGRGQAKP